ncbi:MAG TPA: hypothetical protein VI408_12550 [Gaiellaceae bacterium]
MIWAAGIFCLVSVAGSLAFAGSRGWRLYRTVKRTSARLAAEAARVGDAGARVEAKALAASASTEKLTAASARLQVALAELTVIREAAAEPRALLATLRGAVPRK